MEWIEPVFDRTIGDVNAAIQAVAQFKENGTITVHNLKGCLNVSDINRIENNTNYLSQQLSSLGYSINDIIKEWTIAGIPNQEDVLRIINNVQNIISKFCQHPNAPSLPQNMISYDEINTIEENLYLLKVLLDNLKNDNYYSGEFYGGEIQ